MFSLWFFGWTVQKMSHCFVTNFSISNGSVMILLILNERRYLFVQRNYQKLSVARFNLIWLIIFFYKFVDYIVGTNKFTTREADYHRCVGMDPVDWWALHGTHVPELQRFDIRLLSQAANSSAFKRHSSIDGVICSVKRNQLPLKKEENLVYIHSALQLLSQKNPIY